MINDYEQKYMFKIYKRIKKIQMKNYNQTA